MINFPTNPNEKPTPNTQANQKEHAKEPVKQYISEHTPGEERAKEPVKQHIFEHPPGEGLFLKGEILSRFHRYSQDLNRCMFYYNIRANNQTLRVWTTSKEHILETGKTYCMPIYISFLPLGEGSFCYILDIENLFEDF